MYNPIPYLRLQYQRILEKARDFFTVNSGLEQLAVAGIPTNLVRYEFMPRLQNPLDHVFYSRIGDYRVQGGNIIVRRNDGRREVALHPNSVQHNSEGYVRKALTDAGMDPSSAEVKRIAKEVEKLRPKKIG